MSPIENCSLTEAWMSVLIDSDFDPRPVTTPVFDSNLSYAATMIPTKYWSQGQMLCSSSCQFVVEAPRAS